MTEQIINLDNPAEKQMLLKLIRAMTGRKRFTWCESRPRRSDRQNRMYWPCVVQPFGDFLRAQGEPYTDDHLLKHKFLRQTVINKETGEVIGEVTRSTTELTTTEFYDYVEQCVAWLADMFHIECPSPEPYRTEAVSSLPRVR